MVFIKEWALLVGQSLVLLRSLSRSDSEAFLSPIP